MNFQRGYELDLIAAREDKNQRELASYDDDLKLYVAMLIELGENPLYIASILEIPADTIIQWYNNLIVQNRRILLNTNDLSFIRDKNIIRADGRTIGIIVEKILNEDITHEQAAELMNHNHTKVISRWVNMYRMDYEIMQTLPPGVEYKPRQTYVMGIEARDQLQEEIFRQSLNNRIILTGIAGTGKTSVLIKRVSKAFGCLAKAADRLLPNWISSRTDTITL